MYNDYYLQEINNKMATNNNNLNNIIINQNDIIQNQNKIINRIASLEILTALIVLYLFITRCFKC